MLGAMVVGHLGTGGGDTPEVKRVQTGLLGADYEVVNGRYRFSRVYSGENWNPQLRAPLTQPGVNVHAGEYLLAVNGREVRPPENVYSFFEGFAGKSLVIKVGTDPNGAGAREVTVVPAQTSAADALALKPDGIFLSNGPGDPEPCDYAIAAIRTFVEKKIPTYGICLGHQLLGLAVGAKTLKMKFGHHGANHPVIDLDSGRVLITSQNHGFAVDEATLPANVRVTHRSLFDGSNQGLELTDAPAFSFQGHPEASPGPHDVSYLFDRFVASMEAR
jgi:anthranilate/para-aminobenzoate synthase component II